MILKIRLKRHSHTIWNKNFCLLLGLIIVDIDIPLFEIWNTVTYKSVDKEKIKIIMICAHYYLLKKTTKDITE